ncbi:hypothetical protein MD588_08665 [Photobacterium sp. SDRW27]|uniref:hypothetical protein n=1 Tax=Photobacterium obscurum TaxID=2829490 RepID=UPI002243C692|nr:hypothetical protein [Photobacterium obscurum]MCW8328880.1 hypothetical protein [Photobacterium obscurum]
MKNLQKAEALFDKPLTIDELRKLDQLERQAKGQERKFIGALWCTAYAAINPVVLHQARVEGLM